MKNLVYVVVLNLLSIAVAFGQSSNSMPLVSRTYAFTNINIVQAPGRKIDNGTVVIREGLIIGVGKNIFIPVDAIIIKSDSMYVYAGFIDGLSQAGVGQRHDEPMSSDLNSPSAIQAGITPYADVRAMLNPDDLAIEQLRNLGFTTAQVVPNGNFLPGQSAIILLHGKTANEMLLRSHASLYSNLVGTRGIYPSTSMAILAKWRELYRQAVLTKSYSQLYTANPSGLSRPVADRTTESFYPVIDQQLPVLFRSEKLMDVHRVIALKSDLGFPLVLADVKEGWPVTSKIKSSGAKVFLSLDLPEEKKINAAKEKAHTFEGIENDDLEKRKSEAVTQRNAQASEFQKANIAFGFSSYSAKAKDIRSNLRRMIAAGLSEDDALAALTTTPAKFLNLSDKMGTIDNGKIANLVISDKSYFNEKSKIQYVVVDGYVYPVEKKETAKIVGGWSVVIQTSRGPVFDRLNIRKDVNGYAGTYFSEMLHAPTEMHDVILKGNQLSFKYIMGNNGDATEMTAEVIVTGKTFKGVLNGARYKNLVIEGTLDTKN